MFAMPPYKNGLTVRMIPVCFPFPDLPHLLIACLDPHRTNNLHLDHLFSAESDYLFFPYNFHYPAMKVFTLDLPLKLGASRRTFANRRWMSVRPMIFQSNVHPTRESMYVATYPSHNSDAQMQLPRGIKRRFSICTRCAELARRLLCSPHTTSPPHVHSIPTAST